MIPTRPTKVSTKVLWRPIIGHRELSLHQYWLTIILCSFWKLPNDFIFTFSIQTILIIQSSLFRFLTMLTISQITIILNFVIFSNQERFYPLKIPQPIRQHFNLTTRTPSPSSLRLPRDLKSRDVINIGFNQWESRLHSNRPITGLETDFKSIFDEQGDTITISEDAGCCERLLQIK